MTYKFDNIPKEPPPPNGGPPTDQPIFFDLGSKRWIPLTNQLHVYGDLWAHPEQRQIDPIAGPLIDKIKGFPMGYAPPRPPGNPIPPSQRTPGSPPASLEASIEKAEGLIETCEAILNEDFCKVDGWRCTYLSNNHCGLWNCDLDIQGTFIIKCKECRDACKPEPRKLTWWQRFKVWWQRKTQSTGPG